MIAPNRRDRLQRFRRPINRWGRHPESLLGFLYVSFLYLGFRCLGCLRVLLLSS
jgi:hypothetical protein